MSERKNEAKWLEKYQRWQINVQRDGKRKTFYSKTPGTKGKIDAEKQADKWQAALKTPQCASQNCMSCSWPKRSC